MICEKCKNDHNGDYGSGRFCSSLCARSFSTFKNRKEINEKVSKKLKGKIVVSQEQFKKFQKKGQESRKKDPVICLNCSSGIKSRNNKKFCSRECGYEYKFQEKVSQWLNGKIDGVVYKGTSGFIRRYFLKKYDNRCSLCGWSQINKITGKVPLQLDHIDGNWKNNDINNLRLLCPNCHSLTENYGSLNIGNGRDKRPR